MFPLYYFFLILILAYSAIKSMIAIDESKNESTYENLKLKLLKGVEYTTVKPVTKLGVFMNDE